jgi:adenylate cyclase
MKKQLRKIFYGALMGLLAVVLVWIFANHILGNLMEIYESKTYDWRIQQRYTQKPTVEDVVIIDIDGLAVSELGKYTQWPRKYHYKVMKFLKEAGVAGVGLDILYDKDSWRPDDDKKFVDEVRASSNTFTALYFAEADPDNFRYKMTKPPKPFDFERYSYQISAADMPRFKEEERLETEFFELANAGAGAGHVNFNGDMDGVIRKIHLFTRFANRLYPSLGFGMYLKMIGTDSLAFTKKNILSLFSQNEKQADIPVDDKGNMLINYEGPFKTFRYISFYDVLMAKERGLEPDFLKGKVVFIGTSLAGLFDLRTTPLQQAFPGVEIHANIFYTLMQQKFTERQTRLHSFFVMAILGIILGVLLNYTGPLLSVFISFLVGLAYILVAAILYFNHQLWIDIVNPVITLFFTFSFVYLYRYMTEEKNKKFIRTTFSHFVTKSVVDELLANPDKIKLGGEKKVCTVLFSDVAGFTTISERLKPETLVKLLNEYLTAMTNIVFKYDGMLDKYEGDAIMAVFGAPIDQENHAYNACAAALEMQNTLNDMRKLWKKQGRPELNARIGLNSGPMVVGNMGSETRFDYTVMGDAVNLGARLESANKEYGTNIMMGENSYQMAKDYILARPLDLLRVKGKNKPVKVYELVADLKKRPAKELMQTIDLFQKGFENYVQQNWDWAINYFEQALTLTPEDSPSRRYIERCKVFKQTPPADNWDGVFVMKTK